MANNDVRHYLNGLLVEFGENTIRTVATDGHRLSLAEAELSASGEERSEIVPRKGVMELNRILEDIDQPLKIMLGQGFLRVDRDHIVMTTKLIDGKFPEYEAVIPFKSEQPMKVNREALIHELQRVDILSNEKYRGVSIELLPLALSITTHTKNIRPAVT